ncbi:MAG: signal recognition particle receptor subunit alpha, partial [Candidatus Aenigmatarchaeota archaeon]
MFGFLKKKLKKSIEKISSAAKKSEEAAEEVPVEKAPIEQPELIEEEAAPQMPEEVPEEVKEEIVEEAREEAKEEREAVKEAVEEKAADAAEEVAREEIAEEELKEEKPLEPAVGMMEEVKPEEKRGILEKIGLRKPKIIKRIKKAVREKVIEEDDIKGALDDIQTSLLESDVALEVSEKIMKDLKKALVGKSIPKKHIETVVMDSIRNSLLEVLKLPDIDVLKLARTKKPLKIIFLGFNGTGKTTSIAKMAHMFKQNNLRSILAAGDTFRAASIEQLEEHGKRL